MILGYDGTAQSRDALAVARLLAGPAYGTAAGTGEPSQTRL
jgi:hypothetical protein